MPRRGHAWFKAHEEDAYLVRVRRLQHRLQNQRHRAQRDKRESFPMRRYGRKPKRQPIHQRADQV